MTAHFLITWRAPKGPYQQTHYLTAGLGLTENFQHHGEFASRKTAQKAIINFIAEALGGFYPEDFHIQRIEG